MCCSVLEVLGLDCVGAVAGLPFWWVAMISICACFRVIWFCLGCAVGLWFGLI